MTAGVSSSPSPATLSWIELQQFQRTNFWNKACFETVAALAAKDFWSCQSPKENGS